MSPDEIHSVLTMNNPQLKAEPRSNPDGWAYFLGLPQRSANSNRIIRATRSTENAETRLKLAVSSRYFEVEKVISFSGDKKALCQLVDDELELFEKHFSDRRTIMRKDQDAQQRIWRSLGYGGKTMPTSTWRYWAKPNTKSEWIISAPNELAEFEQRDKTIFYQGKEILIARTQWLATWRTLAYFYSEIVPKLLGPQPKATKNQRVQAQITLPANLDVAGNGKVESLT